MIIIEVRHRTTYSYRRAVRLNPHRLLLRPRESYDLRLVESELVCSPEARLQWTTDVFGNSVARASFDAPSIELSVDSRVVLEQHAPAWPVFAIAVSALTYPFNYSADETRDLGAFLTPHYPDSQARLKAWASTFLRGAKTDTLSLLRDLNAGVRDSAHYEVREEEGVQQPLQTLDRGTGSCRDLALLYAEAARVLGFGVRITSGYLYNSDTAFQGAGHSGSTHAWAEVYLPDAGWIAFDPTNGTMGSGHLIPVAVGRDLRSLSPIAGGYVGERHDFLALNVTVTVTPRFSAT